MERGFRLGGTAQFCCSTHNKEWQVQSDAEDRLRNYCRGHSTQFSAVQGLKASTKLFIGTVSAPIVASTVGILSYIYFGETPERPTQRRSYVIAVSSTLNVVVVFELPVGFQIISSCIVLRKRTEQLPKSIGIVCSLPIPFLPR